MDQNKKKIILLVTILKKITIFSNHQEAIDAVTTGLTETHNSPFVLSFVNAHAVNLCYKNELFSLALMQSDLVLRDGSGMSLLYKLLKQNPGANLNGTDFIPEVINHFKNKKIALLGSMNTTVNIVEQKLLQEQFKISIVMDGFQELQDYIDVLNTTDADIVLLGMGMPKQEILSAKIKDHVRKPMLVINGGAIIDFMSNTIPRAPKWMRKLGLEWFYRLAIEPKRMWRRYIVGNVVFMVRVMLFKLYSKN